MDSSSLAPSPTTAVSPDRPARMYGVWLALALLAYAWILGSHMSALPGGSDSSGYYNQAKLLSTGTSRVAPNPVDGFSPSNHLWTYSPLGFKPSGDNRTLVATYPTGLPLWIAGAAKVIGWTSAANVVVWLHALAGVVLMYAAGRVFGLSKPMAFAGAALLGTSPVYLFFSVQTMSDVAALVWVLAAIVAAWRGQYSTIYAAVAGAAFAMAVLVRPTNALALVPLAVIFGFRLRSWVAFGSGGIPGAIYFCFYNRAAYGALLTTGYGEIDVAWHWVGMTLRHYVIWLPVVFSPAIVGLVALPWVRSNDRRTVWLFVIWFTCFAAFYAAYRCTHETWWYLRFLLPAAPAIILGALLGIAALIERWPNRIVRAFILAGIVAALGSNIGWSRHWSVLRAGEEDAKYRLVSQWLQQRAPADSIVVCMQQSGALRFYTDFAQVRLDMLTPEDFDHLLTAADQHHRPLYAATFPFEVDSLQQLGTQSKRGRWERAGTVRDVALWHWSVNASP